MLFNLFSRKKSDAEAETAAEKKAPEGPPLEERLNHASQRKSRYCIDGLSGAVSILRDILEENPFHAQAQAMLAESYGYLGTLREAEELEFESCYEKAMTHAEAALHIDPQLAAAHRAMSVALRKGPRANSAQRRDEARAAVELDPEDGENWIELWRAMGRPTNDETLSQSIRLGATNVGLWIDFGVEMFKTKRLPEAETYLQRALQYSPGNALATVNLAMVLHAKRKFRLAKDLIEDALREDACSTLLKKAHSFLGSGAGRNIDVWANTKGPDSVQADPAEELARGF